MLIHNGPGRYFARRYVAATNSPTPASGFFSRLATPPTAARRQLYNTLIQSLMVNGVWQNLDVLYIMAAADQATALTNLVSGSFTGTAVNTPTFTIDRGIAGNGSTSYVDTGYTPSTASGKLTLNNAHISIWDLTNRAPADVLAVGTRATGTADFFITPYHFTNNGETRVTDFDIGPYATITNKSNGLFLGTRTASNARAYYFNGGLGDAGSETTTGSITANPIFIGGFNNNGSLGAATSDQFSVFSVGAGLAATQVTAFYNALNTYLQAVGAV